MSTEDICIVVQGPSSNVSDVREAWKHYTNQLVYCTWNGNENLYTQTDNVLFIDMPLNRGIGNLNLQKITTNCGIKYAKDNGYKRVLKIRSDMIPTNPEVFLKHFSEETFEVFALAPDQGGYYTDYFMCGKIDVMESIWNVDIEKQWLHAEQALMNNIKNVCKDDVSLYIEKMNEYNEVYWFKYSKFLRESWLKSVKILKQQLGMEI